MPTYEYACKGCSNRFEKRLKMADRDAPSGEPCAECGGEIYQSLGAPQIVSGVRSSQSAPNGFKDVLREIKKTSGKGCTIDV